MAESSREYYRVPCEFQIRFRKIENEEFQVFKSFGMRPSAFSSLKADIDSQLSRLPVKDESKVLLEKAFQVLINIDQRLERLEENLTAMQSGEPGKKVLESYTWVRGDLGAGGLSFFTEDAKGIKVGEHLLFDFILPSLPEQRIVAAGRVVHAEVGQIGLEFEALHDDDREFIHRYVVAREREILRARAVERDRPKEG